MNDGVGVKSIIIIYCHMKTFCLPVSIFSYILHQFQLSFLIINVWLVSFYLKSKNGINSRVKNVVNIILIIIDQLRPLDIYKNIVMSKLVSDSEEKEKRYSRKLDHQYRLSEPKTGVNLVKINKNKLPPDFFSRKQSPRRRISQLKPIINQRASEPFLPSQKAESERVCNSPQKTSFFGCIQDEDLHSQYIRGKYTARNIQRKKESKQDIYLIESARKLTTATRPDRQFVEQLPPLQEVSDFLGGQNICNITFSPQKTKHPQFPIDNQPLTAESITTQRSNCNQIPFRKQSANSIRITKVATSETPQDQYLDMTFFKAKSTYLPPIHRSGNP